MSTLLRAAMAALAALALAACQSGSSGSAGDGASPAARSANAGDTQINPEPLRRLGYRWNWLAGTPDAGGPTITRLDVAGDLLLEQNNDGLLIAREPATGSIRWTADLGSPLTTYVGNARIRDRVLASSESEVQILSAQTGELLDRQRLAELVNTPPVVVGNILIYGCATGEVLGHNLITGYKQWGYALPGRITADVVPMAEGEVGAVSQAGAVVMLGPDGRSGGRQQSIFDGVASDPVSDGARLYVASLDQSIYAFDRRDGREVWRIRTQRPITDQPTIHDGVLYVTVRDPEIGLMAIEGRRGTTLWTNPEATGEVLAMRRGRLIVRDGSTFRIVDPQRGDVIETLDAPSVDRVVIDGFEDGTIYLSTRDGAIAKFTSD